MSDVSPRAWEPLMQTLSFLSCPVSFSLIKCHPIQYLTTTRKTYSPGSPSLLTGRNLLHPATKREWTIRPTRWKCNQTPIRDEQIKCVDMALVPRRPSIKCADMTVVPKRPVMKCRIDKCAEKTTDKKCVVLISVPKWPPKACRIHPNKIFETQITHTPHKQIRDNKINR